MLERALIVQRELLGHLKVMEGYLQQRLAIHDRHGVRDAIADIEQIEAKLSLLALLLGSST